MKKLKEDTNKYSMDLQKLASNSQLRDYLKMKLDFAPLASNYLIENVILDGKFCGKIVNTYSNFHFSNTHIKRHLELSGINKKHKLMFNKKQFKQLTNCFKKLIQDK